MSSSNYQQLINKLDQFIRKYYINKLIRGGLYFVGLVLALFLIFNFLEYNLYFNQGVRKLLFYSFIATTLMGLGFWVIDPLVRYFKLGATISHDQAAQIVGQHFQDVKDKLLNILQLKRQEGQTENFDLLEASIQQKAEALSPVPFKNAIDLSANRRYLRYALPPLLLFIGVLMLAPSIITEGTHRIINNNKDFKRAALFSFVLEEENPSVIQFEDYTIQVTTDGSVVPNEAFIEVGNFQYRLQKEAEGVFTYTFRNVQKDTPFRFFSGRETSESKMLKVLPKPNLTAFKVDADYPDYTQRKDEIVSNIGDLVIPEGTILKWSFDALNTNTVRLKFTSDEEMITATQKEDDLFEFKKQVVNNDLYKVFISNEFIPKGDSVAYTINVIKDQYPTISVESFTDSLEKDYVYFVGQASDDYGMRSITFNYTITHDDGQPDPLRILKLSEPQERESPFDYTLDVNELNLLPGDQVSYYFEVRDNDAINGSKSSKTGIMTFKKPSLEDLKEMENANEEAIKDNLEESLKNLDKLQENYRKMREKLLQEKELDWQDKESLEKLLEEQKEIQEKLEKAKEKFDENMKNQEEMEEQSPEMKEKQERLEDMFNEAMDPEKEELMEKIQELLQELNKDEALEMMEQMEMDNQTMEKEMDRLLELYKQLEVEKEVNDLAKDLEKLAEEQEELAEKTSQEENPSEELQKEQEELNEKMEKLKEEMEDIEKKNEELKNPKDLGEENEEQMDDIQEEMENASEEMQKDSGSKASESQKSASEKMKKMAGSLQSSMQSGDMQQQAEDIKAIRQLLENLVGLSFDQEDLVDEFRVTRSITPKYVELIQQQFKLKDDFRIIEDSLVALANRNDKIESFVMDKVADIKSNIKQSLDELEERKTSQASDLQRRTMKNVNDLALMLSESMENMQQSMSGGMPGTQMCQKPGGSGNSGKVPMDKITEGSKELGKQLKDMQGKMSQGEKPSSKDFAQAAARLAAMRKALEDMQKESREQGKGSKELEELIKDMDQIETDLVNKRLDGELLKRQQDITTRLLEAEKAQRQREFDDKRKAETAVEKKKELPPSLQEYLKKKEAEVEMYKTISPALRPYYKYLVDEYYRALKDR